MATSSSIANLLVVVLAVMVSVAVAQTLPFTIPFNASSYTGGSIHAFSDSKATAAVFSWRVEGDLLYGAVAANVNGWVGFGLNDNQPSMPEADIILCRNLESSGAISASDMNAPRFDVPLYDDHQVRLLFDHFPLLCCRTHSALYRM